MSIRFIEGGGVAITPPHVMLFRLVALKGRLELEMRGFHFRGRATSTILREEFGFKGSRRKQLEQLKARIEEYRREHPADEEGV